MLLLLVVPEFLLDVLPFDFCELRFDDDAVSVFFVAVEVEDAAAAELDPLIIFFVVSALFFLRILRSRTLDGDSLCFVDFFDADLEEDFDFLALEFWVLFDFCVLVEDLVDFVVFPVEEDFAPVFFRELRRTLDEIFFFAEEAAFLTEVPTLEDMSSRSTMGVPRVSASVGLEVRSNISIFSPVSGSIVNLPPLRIPTFPYAFDRRLCFGYNFDPG